MKTVAIVQARMGSTRLPGKVMRSIMGVPMIELLLKRLSKAEELDEIVLAISDRPENDVLEDYVKSLGYATHRGSETDVLGRYYDAAKSVNATAIVRVTGDCPLVDPGLVDQCIQTFLKDGVDYASNIEPASFPDGLDIEVFKFESLEKAQKEVTAEFDREHVTPYLRRNGFFTKSNVESGGDYVGMRWTVDELADFSVISSVFEHFAPDIDFSWKDVLSLQGRTPELFAENSDIRRNEGGEMGQGQKLWKRAKAIIPGGNMLLSKRAEMFLPEYWPAYYSKAKGCMVWDLDDAPFVDMSIMGIGTNILGYGHPEVDEAVAKVVSQGNMATLNCPEEVLLAERLVEMHPWAEMAKFARTGGEANAVAIRIARAASGRDKVAICGYHGWHDWYLSANLGGDGQLAGHLLPGLEPNGVPSSLKDTVLPFNYNDIEELKRLVAAHEIGVIKMEVSRNSGPEEGFLEKVREIANQNNIVLVFDECTSGFRQTFGGLHKKYGVEPDMAIFGKALGNGYAITAILGTSDVMQAAQSTFISSTFWTERIGPAAALKTLDVMERDRSWEFITKQGNKITNRWKSLAQEYGLEIETAGLPALTSFSFNSQNALKYKTLITQEMLKEGYLAGTSVYVCTEHTDERIDVYFDKLADVFEIIRDCENGKNIDEILDGPVCHSGFKRLN